MWDPESKEEKQAAKKTIAELNKEKIEMEGMLNKDWKESEEYLELKEQELAEARRLKALDKELGTKTKTTQSWRGKKYKCKKLKRGEGKGVDSWRYVEDLARPILWPFCQDRLLVNPQFVLMEDNAPAHASNYINEERLKYGIVKVDWPPNSPDLNPIERIWTLIKSRIQKRRGEERITTVGAMKKTLEEEWEKLTIEEINREISKLPSIVKKCIAINGGNNFYA